jgi:hypothetical protein
MLVVNAIEADRVDVRVEPEVTRCAARLREVQRSEPADRSGRR